jgi:hypothetical protein
MTDRELRIKADDLRKIIECVNYENLKELSQVTTSEEFIREAQERMARSSDETIRMAKERAGNVGDEISSDDIYYALIEQFKRMGPSIDEMKDAVENARDKLRTRESFNSSWQIATHILCLRELGEANYSRTIQKLVLKLKNMRNSEGLWYSGWPWEKEKSANVYDNAFAMVALIEAGDSSSVSNAKNYIESMIEPNYLGWPSKKGEEIDTGATSWAMIALKACVGENSIFVERGKQWLIANQREDGGWGAHWKGKSKISLVTKTYDAMEALLDAGMDPKSNEIKKARNWLISLQGAVKSEKVGGELGWAWEKDDTIKMSGIENTACAIMALIRSGEELDQWPAILVGVIWLMKERNKEGDWGEVHTPRVAMCLKRISDAYEKNLI